MDSKRQLQVASVIKREFSMVLQNEGPNIYGVKPLITVTNVKISPDFGIARIYLSVFNTEDKQSVILMLETELKRLRQSLGARIRKKVRKIPYLELYLDDTLDEMYRLNALFDKLHEDNQMGENQSEEKPEEEN